jgi:pyruvate/2-oxoglutarate dehydrogenase complex dihydrolipoamide acyltransferase (E2) component
MKPTFQPEWRTQNRAKRRFYAKYMRWLEVAGYLTVAAVVCAFIYAFNYKVDDIIEAADVKLMPLERTTNAQSNGIVTKVLVEPFTEVKKGQPIMEIAEGDANVTAYNRWAAIESLRGDSRAASLVAANPKPPVKTLVADADGTIRIDKSSGQFAEKDVLFAVLDYSQIVLEASLTGASVSKAATGQIAQISAIKISGNSSIFRGSTEKGPVLSSEIISAKAIDSINSQLEGKSLALRDDIPLQITKVTGVEVDAKSSATTTKPSPAETMLEPPATFTLNAEVVSGKPTATAQLADLPAELRQQISAAIAADVSNRSIKQLDGADASLGEVSVGNVVLKVDASEPAGTNSANSLSGTMLKRAYEAKLKLVNPPKFIVDMLRAAHQKGKDVTARVQLKTSEKPFAFILLKRS